MQQLHFSSSFFFRAATFRATSFFEAKACKRLRKFSNWKGDLTRTWQKFGWRRLVFQNPSDVLFEPLLSCLQGCKLEPIDDGLGSSPWQQLASLQTPLQVKALPLPTECSILVLSCASTATQIVKNISAQKINDLCFSRVLPILHQTLVGTSMQNNTYICRRSHWKDDLPRAHVHWKVDLTNGVSIQIHVSNGNMLGKPCVHRHSCQHSLQFLRCTHICPENQRLR